MNLTGPVNTKRVENVKGMTLPFGHRLSILAAAVLSFLAALDPNASLRYGPFIAFVSFLFSSPSKARFGRTEWLLLAYVFWAFISQYWAEYPNRFSLAFMTVLSLAIIFLGIRAAVSVGGLAFVIFAYIVGGFLALARTSLAIFTSDQTVVDSSGRITQVGELNVNYVAYTAITSVVLLLLLIRSSFTQRRSIKLLLGIAIILIAAGAIATQTRGAQISLGLAVLSCIIYKFRLSAKVSLFVCAVLTVLVSSGRIDSLLAFFDYGGRTESGLSGRLGIWEIARISWSYDPFLGIGLGGIRELTPYGLSTHNVFLGVGNGLGIIGLVMFLAFLASSQVDRLLYLGARERSFRLILVPLVFLPVVLSSSWEMSASGWVGLALLSVPVYEVQKRTAGF